MGLRDLGPRAQVVSQVGKRDTGGARGVARLHTSTFTHTRTRSCTRTRTRTHIPAGPEVSEGSMYAYLPALV